MNASKILIIGAGGIGRSLVALIKELLDRRIPYVLNKSFTIIDFDEVDEQNLWTQGYKRQSFEDALTKVAALKRELPAAQFQHVNGKVTKDADLAPYDTIFIAVDNLETRRFVYEHCRKNGKYFVDMRVNGTVLLVQDSDTPKADQDASLVAGDDEAPTSCLYKHEKEKGIIHTTPMVAAAVGFQFFLNKLREESNSPVEMSM